MLRLPPAPPPLFCKAANFFSYVLDLLETYLVIDFEPEEDLLFLLEPHICFFMIVREYWSLSKDSTINIELKKSKGSK